MISAIIVSRNDNYGGNLIERSTYSINSAIDTYDEVIYVDWNSDTHSLLYDLKANINFKGNLKHIVITPEIASILTNNDPNAQKCCEVLARNIGIRRAIGDIIISTNIDVIHPKRKDLDIWLDQKFDKNTFYTLSRRDITLEDVIKHTNNKLEYSEWELARDQLSLEIPPKYRTEKVVEGDDYSIINCCGDFQIAHSNVWGNIRGFEEELIYSLYTDTNIQKKAIMHGFGLKAIFEPPIFHIFHGKGGCGFLDGINKRANDPMRAIVMQNKTHNDENWGFNNIEIEYEIL